MLSRMGDFKKLDVWQAAHSLACAVYLETVGFPKNELYGLTSQLRRAATSIPANLAEGSGRGGDIEFSRFVRMSLGSANELEYHLLLSRDVGFLPESVWTRLTNEVLKIQAMLARLHTALKGGALKRGALKRGSQ